MMVKTTLCLLALLAAPTMAHQPVVVPDQNYPVSAPYEVEMPEVSKAFFAKLGGHPDYYRIVRVFNAENTGRYVLAIGDRESFPLDVIVRTMIMMPGINRDYWSGCLGE